jgi:hypothetical protein
MGGVQLYRNPNQIQLASTAAGFPVLVSNTIGLALSGPLGGVGNATTTPGGAIFNAPDFHVVHLGYRLERRGLRLGSKEVPAWFVSGVAESRCTKLGDAFMAGQPGAAGRHVRALYRFAIKDASSMISQFPTTIGNRHGSNAIPAMRFDLGYHFLQCRICSSSNTAASEQQPSSSSALSGAGLTFRYLGQLAFTF